MTHCYQFFCTSPPEDSVSVQLAVEFGKSNPEAVWFYIQAGDLGWYVPLDFALRLAALIRTTCEASAGVSTDLNERAELAAQTDLVTEESTP